MSTPLETDEEGLSTWMAVRTTLAPPGQVWVCAVCGKRSRTRVGFDKDKNSTVIDDGFDSSCASHAVLCYAEKRNGRYRAVEAS